MINIILWDLDKNGELILSCPCADIAYNSTVTLTCADVSNLAASDDDINSISDESDNDIIFLGASDGKVMGYNVQELISSDSECPAPNLRFRAHGRDTGKAESISAIKCGGDGTVLTTASSGSISRNPGLSSIILLTGGEDGAVKQWCVCLVFSSSWSNVSFFFVPAHVYSF